MTLLVGVFCGSSAQSLSAEFIGSGMRSASRTSSCDAPAFIASSFALAGVLGYEEFSQGVKVAAQHRQRDVSLKAHFAAVA